MRVHTYSIRLSSTCGDKKEINVITPNHYSSDELMSLIENEPELTMNLSAYSGVETALCDTEIYNAWNAKKDYFIST
ncbi:hypothetical protein VTH8203_02827 [Vibrio thalassae]|uniref:Uncharacterized protein n=1 Tax=Vibrio thalassae TaxID=1243014 RepID=A0A240EKL1_9VIBR|nr:hypothetical protein [Vibrio thalassae]SNX49184.1 hypothetical protein VTH8203_02827 [Vibrio thalassae]